MLLSLTIGWRLRHQMITLVLDVLLQQVEQARGGSFRNRATVELGRRRCRNDRSSLVAYLCGRHAPDVQGWVLQGFLEVATNPIRFSNAKPPVQFRLIVRSGVHDASGFVVERHPVIVT